MEGCTTCTSSSSAFTSHVSGSPVHLLSVFSLRNRALIALVTIVVAVFGGIALTSLKQELAPSVQFPQIAIVSSYPGATPEVVNDDVSTPIEQAVQIIPGLEGTTATSSTSQSTVSAEFTYGTDLNSAEQKIQSAINRLSLPDSVDTQVVTGSLDDLPVIQIAVTGYDQADAQTLVDHPTGDRRAEEGFAGVVDLRRRAVPRRRLVEGRTERAGP